MVLGSETLNLTFCKSESREVTVQPARAWLVRHLQRDATRGERLIAGAACSLQAAHSLLRVVFLLGCCFSLRKSRSISMFTSRILRIVWPLWQTGKTRLFFTFAMFVGLDMDANHAPLEISVCLQSTRKGYDIQDT